MHGPDFARPSPEIIDIFSKGSTASYTTIFSRQGIRDIWMPIKPLFRGDKTVGPALTIRSLPKPLTLETPYFTFKGEFTRAGDHAIHFMGRYDRLARSESSIPCTR